MRRRGFAMAVTEASAVARKVVSGSPTGQPPAPKLRKRARATRPLRGCRGSFSRRPESFLGKPDGPAPSAKIRKRARATRPLRGCRGSFGRRPENFLGKPDGPDPTGTSFRAARRARPKPKPSTILHIAKNGTRRARAGFLRTLNPKGFRCGWSRGGDAAFAARPHDPRGRGRASSWKP